MISAINKFFDSYLKKSENTETTSSVDKIHLASAALMIELCKADQSIDEVETNALASIFKVKYHLPNQAIEELIQLAEQEAKEATSLYQFTSLINDAYEYSDKVLLIKNMWEVAFADGKLDRYEDHLIRKVAELLYISHSDFIKTKLATKNIEASP